MSKYVWDEIWNKVFNIVGRGARAVQREISNKAIRQ
jgi:hypothetical protein